jgi:Family of unknown function (DUF6088)
VNLAQAIIKRVRHHGQPWVFTPKDFLDLGTPHAVGMTLLRLVRNNGVRRLARGLYDCPQKHPVLGLLSPPIEAIAEALAGRDGTRIQPSGAYAANLLHLSEQVPARIVYHTDGASRQVRIGKQTIILKHAAPSRLRAHNRMSGLVIQALRYLGKTHVTEDRVKQLQTLLSSKDRRQLLNDLASAPVWMHRHLRAIAGKESKR